MTGNPKNISNRRTEMKANKKTIRKIAKKKSVMQWSLLLPLQYMAFYIIYSALSNSPLAQFVCPIVFHSIVGAEMMKLEGSRKILKKNRFIYTLVGGAAALYYLRIAGISPAEIWATVYFLASSLLDCNEFANGLLAPFKEALKTVRKTDPLAALLAVATVIAFSWLNQYETAMEYAGYAALVFGVFVLGFYRLTKHSKPKEGGHK